MNPGTYTCAGDTAPVTQNTVVANASGIPISMARVGDRGTIVSISGKEEVKRFLATLGFTPGAQVRAVCEANGNMILDIKGSKIAIDRKMASKILFCPES